jgi:putative glutathione S-transferase
MMGLLVDGVWRDQWYDTKASDGRFERDASKFRNWVTPDGAPGPSGRGGFKAEPGRYHLYAAYFCPWAHRTLIFRELKGLAPLIGVSITHWLMRENGITFAPGDGVAGDPIHNARFLYEVYRAAAPDYTGRVTVPVLWDRQNETIVSNESQRSSACSTPPSMASARRPAISIRRGCAAKSIRSTRGSIRR